MLGTFIFWGMISGVYAIIAYLLIPFVLKQWVYPEITEVERISIRTNFPKARSFGLFVLVAVSLFIVGSQHNIFQSHTEPENEVVQKEVRKTTYSTPTQIEEVNQESSQRKAEENKQDAKQDQKQSVQDFNDFLNSVK